MLGKQFTAGLHHYCLSMFLSSVVRAIRSRSGFDWFLVVVVVVLFLWHVCARVYSCSLWRERLTGCLPRSLHLMCLIRVLNLNPELNNLTSGDCYLLPRE